MRSLTIQINHTNIVPSPYIAKIFLIVLFFFHCLQNLKRKIALTSFPQILLLYFSPTSFLALPATIIPIPLFLSLSDIKYLSPVPALMFPQGFSAGNVRQQTAPKCPTGHQQSALSVLLKCTTCSLTIDARQESGFGRRVCISLFFVRVR